MAFVEQAHVNDIGTVFRVTVYDTTSTGGTTVANISSASTKKFIFKNQTEALLKEPQFSLAMVLMVKYNMLQWMAIFPVPELGIYKPM